MINTIKEIRLLLDGFSRLANDLTPIITHNFGENSRVGENIPMYEKQSEETASCAKKLIFSKAWLGKCLSELGDKAYLNDGKRKTVDDIEPTAEKVNFNVKTNGKIFPIDPDGYHIGNYANLNHIEKVDWLRQEIEKATIQIKDLPTKDLSREFAIARTNAYSYCCEARMELGFELERLKNQSKNNGKD